VPSESNLLHFFGNAYFILMMFFASFLNFFSNYVLDAKKVLTTMGNTFLKVGVSNPFNLGVIWLY
jgi:hypothetical protein